MKKVLYVAAIASVTLFNACQKAEIGSESSQSLTAVIEDDSKTSLNGLKITWSAGDAFKTFSGNTYTLAAGVGTNEGSFNGSGAVANEKAVYPASKTTLKSGKYVISYASDLANQTYGANINGNLPMVGTVNGDATKVIFTKPLLGVIRLNLTADEANKVKTIDKITITFNSKSNWKSEIEIDQSGNETYNSESSLTNVSIVVNKAIGDGLTVDIVSPVSKGSSGYSEQYVRANISFRDSSSSSPGSSSKSIKVEPGKVTTINWNVKQS